MSRSSSKSNPFRTPPINYDCETLIRAMAQCREEVERLTRECGYRAPLRREAEAVVLDLDALAKPLPEGQRIRSYHLGPFTRHRGHANSGFGFENK